MEPIFAFALVVGFAIVSWTYQRSRSTQMLDEWARANGLRIVNADRALLFRGPFTLTTSNDQTVYKITVEDASGRTMTGWARCGSWFLGLMSGNVEVVWD